MFTPIAYPEEKNERYAMLLAQAKALLDPDMHPIANLANISALLGSGLNDINWVGFYLMHNGALMLGPFCGLPACIRIPLGRGVCGTAATSEKIQRVDDVHAFPGHIACDGASNSEIVLPIRQNGRVVGVLDIDSPLLCRFDRDDEQALEQLVFMIENACDFDHTGYVI